MFIVIVNGRGDVLRRVSTRYLMPEGIETAANILLAEEIAKAKARRHARHSLMPAGYEPELDYSWELRNET